MGLLYLHALTVQIISINIYSYGKSLLPQRRWTKCPVFFSGTINSEKQRMTFYQKRCLLYITVFSPVVQKSYKFSLVSCTAICPRLFIYVAGYRGRQNKNFLLRCLGFFAHTRKHVCKYRTRSNSNLLSLSLHPVFCRITLFITPTNVLISILRSSSGSYAVPC